jgi:hypothetical protein
VRGSKRGTAALWSSVVSSTLLTLVFAGGFPSPPLQAPSVEGSAQLLGIGGPLAPAQGSPQAYVQVTNLTSASVPCRIGFVAVTVLGSPPYQESWEFGDGGTAQGVSQVSHQFTQAGAYLVLFNLVDSVGRRATATTHVECADYAVPGSPTVSVSTQVAQSAPNATAISFDASPPVFTVDTIAKYQWVFGDGSSSTTQAPVHSYSAPGVYDVSLSVEFNESFPGYPNQTWWNATYFLDEIVVQPNSAPAVVQIGVNVTRQGDYCTGPVTDDFQLSADLAGGSGPFAYGWSLDALGSGNNTQTVDLGSPASGSYDVSVQVIDSAGSTASNAYTLQVTPPIYPPVAPCPKPANPSSSGQLTVIAGAVAVLAVVVVVATVWRIRRKHD